jgi:uncharacterized DUF497 family protein
LLPTPLVGPCLASYTLLLTDTLQFHWDRSNQEPMARRGVTPQEIEQLFANDPYSVAYDVSGGEERWTAMGHTASLRVLVVVWTIREGAIRALASREPDPRHREIYLTARGFER